MNGLRFKYFLELSKIRMIPMVLITVTYGFFLSGVGSSDVSNLLNTLIGIALVAAGSSALNNYLEKDTDARMVRTRGRVLPSGKVSPLSALIFGVMSVLAGVFLLIIQVNLLTAFLLLLASFLYVLVYTPMKRWSWWNTFVGAVPGAIPPLAGWAAATGEIGPGAWILFFILFTWQHPHFYAIAIMHARDYKRANLKMLPVIEKDRRWTYRQIVVYSILLILVSLLPTTIGLTGSVYLVGALLLGIFMFLAGIRLCLEKTDLQARRLFRASLVYLPVLLVLLMVDFGFLQ